MRSSREPAGGAVSLVNTRRRSRVSRRCGTGWPGGSSYSFLLRVDWPPSARGPHQASDGSGDESNDGEYRYGQITQELLAARSLRGSDTGAGRRSHSHADECIAQAVPLFLDGNSVDLRSLKRRCAARIGDYKGAIRDAFQLSPNRCSSARGNANFRPRSNHPHAVPVRGRSLTCRGNGQNQNRNSRARKGRGFQHRWLKCITPIVSPWPAPAARNTVRSKPPCWKHCPVSGVSDPSRRWRPSPPGRNLPFRLRPGSLPLAARDRSAC